MSCRKSLPRNAAKGRRGAPLAPPGIRNPKFTKICTKSFKRHRIKLFIQLFQWDNLAKPIIRKNFFSDFRQIPQFSTFAKKTERQGRLRACNEWKNFLSHSLQAIKLLPFSPLQKGRKRQKDKNPCPISRGACTKRNGSFSRLTARPIRGMSFLETSGKGYSSRSPAQSWVSRRYNAWL